MNDVMTDVHGVMGDDVYRLASAVYISVRNDLARKLYFKFRGQPVDQIGLAEVLKITQAQMSRILNNKEKGVHQQQIVRHANSSTQSSE